MDGYVYVLELQGGKFYVGYTTNICRRIAEHFMGLGAMWTKKHKPLRCLSCVEGGRPLENAITAQLMVQKGYQNVRGAGFCKVEQNEPEFLQQVNHFKLFSAPAGENGRPPVFQTSAPAGNATLSESCETPSSSPQQDP